MGERDGRTCDTGGEASAATKDGEGGMSDHMDEDKLGARIRKLRKALKIPTQELSKSMGVTESYVREVENYGVRGTGVPRKYVIALCEYLLSKIKETSTPKVTPSPMPTRLQFDEIIQNHEIVFRGRTLTLQERKLIDGIVAAVVSMRKEGEAA